MEYERQWLNVRFDPFYRTNHISRCAEPEANAVSSVLDTRNGKVLHAPALDIDLSCKLIPSSTEGHFHLYIDKPMTWKSYQRLLTVLADVGILERGYAEVSTRQEMTILRREGAYKTVESEFRILKEKILAERRLFP